MVALIAFLALKTFFDISKSQCWDKEMSSQKMLIAT